MMWHGDIFVVKLDPVDGQLLDVLPSDIKDIGELLERYLFYFISTWLSVLILPSGHLFLAVSFDSSTRTLSPLFRFTSLAVCPEATRIAVRCFYFVLSLPTIVCPYVSTYCPYVSPVHLLIASVIS